MMRRPRTFIWALTIKRSIGTKIMMMDGIRETKLMLLSVRKTILAKMNKLNLFMKDGRAFLWYAQSCNKKISYGFKEILTQWSPRVLNLLSKGAIKLYKIYKKDPNAKVKFKLMNG